MLTRKTFLTVAWIIAAVVVALVAVSWATDSWAVLAWPAAALLMMLATVITAVRAQRKGQAKRDRDEQSRGTKRSTLAEADTTPPLSDQVRL